MRKTFTERYSELHSELIKYNPTEVKIEPCFKSASRILKNVISLLSSYFFFKNKWLHKTYFTFSLKKLFVRFVCVSLFLLSTIEIEESISFVQIFNFRFLMN